MITNLFSIFDPSTSGVFRLNWLRLVCPVLIIPLAFWAVPSRNSIAHNLMRGQIEGELKTTLIKKNYKTLIIFYGIFIFILVNNLMGLYPYTFTATRHLIVTLSLGLPYWGLLILYGWINISKHMFAHLVPLGTPFRLSPFMVFIETISNLIRPITLSVRLTANIIAGHLLLRLLSEISEKMPIIYFPSIIVLISLLILEYAVAIIQRYVFITLTSLYLAEID